MRHSENITIIGPNGSLIGVELDSGGHGADDLQAAVDDMDWAIKQIQQLDQEDRFGDDV